VCFILKTTRQICANFFSRFRKKHLFITTCIEKQCTRPLTHPCWLQLRIIFLLFIETISCLSHQLATNSINLHWRCPQYMAIWKRFLSWWKITLKCDLEIKIRSSKIRSWRSRSDNNFDFLGNLVMYKCGTKSKRKFCGSNRQSVLRQCGGFSKKVEGGSSFC